MLHLFFVGKISNRLSSDTDNETDRLLGSQRNDQLKLTNSDVNGSNSTDLQPVSSNMMKQNASSKEGKMIIRIPAYYIMNTLFTSYFLFSHSPNLPLHPQINFFLSNIVLIEGVLFNVKYLGSTHSDCEGRSEKEDRIHQAEMAVQEVKVSNLKEFRRIFWFKIPIANYCIFIISF